ncbi:hypothetical protein SUGI_1509810 [Cryptomeria japonica]|uniref:Uncharacterized protein n=1 Tax=Cryptomeria japonica TaxID=3369 RepID=A0AAD3NW39_CRYJA|nr:hypothetical protein SUGI_1508160 [Cryptomeria japonica]GLJ59472.1 hypothetical protein SUGI_1509810 [Cryptomeria japonica]
MSARTMINGERGYAGAPTILCPYYSMVEEDLFHLMFRLLPELSTSALLRALFVPGPTSSRPPEAEAARTGVDPFSGTRALLLITVYPTNSIYASLF